MNSREEFERFVRDDLGLTETDDLSGTTDNVKYVWDKARESQAAALSEAVEALREIHDFLSDVYCAHPDDATDLNKWMKHAKAVLAKYQEEV